MQFCKVFTPAHCYFLEPIVGHFGSPMAGAQLRTAASPEGPDFRRSSFPQHLDGRARRGLIKKVKKQVANEDGEAGSFLTSHPVLSLTGDIFEEAEAALHHISKRVKRLFHFAGAAVVGQYDREEEN